MSEWGCIRTPESSFSLPKVALYILSKIFNDCPLFPVVQTEKGIEVSPLPIPLSYFPCSSSSLFFLLPFRLKEWGGVFQRRHNTRRRNPVMTMKDWIRPSTLSRLTLQTNCVTVVHSPPKTLEIRRVEWRPRVYIKCQSTIISESSPATSSAMRGFDRPSIQDSRSNQEAMSLRIIAIGQREIPLSILLLRGRSIRLSYNLQTMQLTANGSSFSSFHR